MRVRGLKPGRVVVTLRAKISQSMNHPNQYQLDKDLELKDTVEIVVLDDLRLTSPSHMPENNLLLAPGSHTHLKTNKEEGNTFKLLSGTKIASVDQSGVVKAGSAAGDAVIEITNVDRSGHVQVWPLTHFLPAARLVNMCCVSRGGRGKGTFSFLETSLHVKPL